MKPYDTEQDKKEQVREMFDRIAPAYDRLNHTLSFQIDKLWRRHVVRIVRRMQPRRILDVATGTGDLALAMARRMRGVQVLGVDLSENMLAEARRKATACGLDERVVLSLGDAERLEVADASVDVVTVAFGVRNFGDLGAGLREIAAEIEAGRFEIEPGTEDVHSQVELMLTRRLGDAGKKIHSGRSRNDQVALDLRLYLKDEIAALQLELDLVNQTEVFSVEL